MTRGTEAVLFQTATHPRLLLTIHPRCVIPVAAAMPRPRRTGRPFSKVKPFWNELGIGRKPSDPEHLQNERKT